MKNQERYISKREAANLLQKSTRQIDRYAKEENWEYCYRKGRSQRKEKFYGWEDVQSKVEELQTLHRESPLLDEVVEKAREPLQEELKGLKEELKEELENFKELTSSDAHLEGWREKLEKSLEKKWSEFEEREKEKFEELEGSLSSLSKGVQGLKKEINKKGSPGLFDFPKSREKFDSLEEELQQIKDQQAQLTELVEKGENKEDRELLEKVRESQKALAGQLEELSERNSESRRELESLEKSQVELVSLLEKQSQREEDYNREISSLKESQERLLEIVEDQKKREEEYKREIGVLKESHSELAQILKESVTEREKEKEEEREKARELFKLMASLEEKVDSALYDPIGGEEPGTFPAEKPPRSDSAPPDREEEVQEETALVLREEEGETSPPPVQSRAQAQAEKAYDHLDKFYHDRQYREGIVVRGTVLLLKFIWGTIMRLGLEIYQTLVMIWVWLTGYVRPSPGKYRGKGESYPEQMQLLDLVKFTVWLAPSLAFLYRGDYTKSLIFFTGYLGIHFLLLLLLSPLKIKVSLLPSAWEEIRLQDYTFEDPLLDVIRLVAFLGPAIYLFARREILFSLAYLMGYLGLHFILFRMGEKMERNLSLLPSPEKKKESS